MSTNYGFEPTLDGLNTINADSTTATNIICDTIQINTSGTAPTVSALSNDTNIATTAWVTSHASSNYMTLSTTQTASGQKTFSNANTFITGNTVTNSIQSASATTDINIGQNLTTGDIFMGTTSSTGVALNWGSSSNGGSLTFRGGTFNFFATGLLYLRSGATFDINIGDTQSSGILNLGSLSTRTGAINIGHLTTGNAPITIGSSSSSTQTLTNNAITTYAKIVSCAVAPTTANHLCNKTYVDGVAGGSGLLTTNNTFSGTNTFTNTVNLNITGTADTNIGSASNITYLSGNTTVTGSPVVLDYAVSSHSESTAATVLTQLNGTFRSTVTWTAWTTGTFNYVMNQFIPGVPGWTWPGGYISLDKGTYSFNFAFSFEDTAAGYNISDLRVGISTSGALTAASTDTTVIANLPGGNRTCYKHYVTTITPSINDIVVEQMSGSFYLSASTAIYPHCRINNSAAGGINTVIFDLTITRIGL